ncbi:hypothetical protein K2X05_04235 [bacterium]|nr:hypothetical protein [bacterium]
MKKYIFIAQFLIAISAFAQNKSSEDEFSCLRELQSLMDPKHYFELKDRGTILYFLRDGYDVGMLDRAHNPAMLVIEKNSLQVCKMNFDHTGNIKFKVSDSSGAIKMAYNPNSPPYFRDLGAMSSAAGRSCANALEGATQTKTTEALQRIIKKALKAYFTQNGNLIPVPQNCSGAAGITASDVDKLRDDVSRAMPVESTNRTKNAEQD